MCFLSQVLADIGGGVGTFQFRLLLLSFTAGIRLSRLRWFLFDCRWCGGWGLGNGDLRGVQVDTIGWGVVVTVGPRHCIQELVKNMQKVTNMHKHIGFFSITFLSLITKNQLHRSGLNRRYLHPTIREAWYTPTHLLTPCSCQGLPLWKQVQTTTTSPYCCNSFSTIVLLFKMGKMCLKRK